MDARVAQVIQHMEHELNRPLTVPELASRAGVSASRLRQLFRHATGHTPGAYLRQLRMARARILIERTTLSVAEVMTQVGITDPSQFARDFRRAHGFSPRSLRVQLRMDGPLSW